MKKKYEKPRLIFESFQLTMGIACCTFDIAMSDPHCCRTKDRHHNGHGGYEKIFYDKHICGHGYVPDDGRYCYQNGTGENIFSS